MDKAHYSRMTAYKVTCADCGWSTRSALLAHLSGAAHAHEALLPGHHAAGPEPDGEWVR